MRIRKIISSFLVFTLAIGIVFFSTEKANADHLDENDLFWDSFSTYYYLYYLDSAEQSVYWQFKDACKICLLGDGIDYSSTGGITVQLDTTMPSDIRSKDSLSKIYEIFCLDNPQYFFLTGEFSLDNEEDAGMITLHMYDDLCEAGSRKSAVKNVKDVLENRFDTIKGEVENRISHCVDSWNNQ